MLTTGVAVGNHQEAAKALVELKRQNDKLGGHTNHAQRIHHHLKVKKDNEELRRREAVRGCAGRGGATQGGPGRVEPGRAGPRQAAHWTHTDHT